MATKADRRAAKKGRTFWKKDPHPRPRCEECGAPAPKGEIPGDHDSPISIGVTTWDGLTIVAWCVCGHEYYS